MNNINLMHDINITNNINLVNNINLEKIKLLKYPFIFMFRLSLYKKYIDDDNLSIIMKKLLIEHSDIFCNYNIKLLFINKLENHPKTKNIINTFYELYLNKLKIIYLISKWYNIYKNKKFWKLLPNEQLLYLENLKKRFYSIYDFSSNDSFIIKTMELLNNNNTNRYIIIENLKERLSLIYKLFGYKIFEKLDIPVILSSSIDDANNDAIILYLRIIFAKINELLTQTILLFNVYNNSCMLINNYISE